MQLPDVGLCVFWARKARAWKSPPADSWPPSLGQCCVETQTANRRRTPIEHSFVHADYTKRLPASLLLNWPLFPIHHDNQYIHFVQQEDMLARAQSKKDDNGNVMSDTQFGTIALLQSNPSYID